jgi:hypothetical protein
LVGIGEARELYELVDGALDGISDFFLDIF